MMPDTDLYLHIGLPKTGTTFLQSRIFPGLPSTSYLGKPDSDLLKGYPGPPYGLLDRCFKRSAVIWREFGDEIFEHLNHRMSGPAGCRRILLSDEGIGTAARKPLFLRIHLEEFSKKAMERGANSVKVICSFRRQDQWLASHYAQRSHRVVGASQEEFEAYIESFLHPGKGYYWNGVMLDYRLLRESLVAAVGVDNVLMQPYEALSEDRFTYLSTLLGFFGFSDADDLARSLAQDRGGERANVRSLDRDRWAIRVTKPADTQGFRHLARSLTRRFGRRFGLTLRRSYAPLPAGLAGEVRMTETLREKILSRYEASNAALATDLGSDLNHYAYTTNEHRTSR